MAKCRYAEMKKGKKERKYRCKMQEWTSAKMQNGKMAKWQDNQGYDIKALQDIAIESFKKMSTRDMDRHEP